jgi:hypothetical protein
VEERAVRAALGFTGAAVLLALAVGAALLAADARSWRTTLREDDALLPAAPNAVTWRPNTHFGSLAERFLGVRDDVEARRGIALYLQTVNLPVRLDNAQQVAMARGRAEQALAAVARDSHGARASQAETLLGVLVFTDVGPSNDPFEETTGVDPDQAQASLADFEDAVRADPENPLAKYDLELALRALLAQGIRVGAGQQTGAGSTGQRGAGGGIPGGGY